MVSSLHYERLPERAVEKLTEVYGVNRTFEFVVTIEQISLEFILTYTVFNGVSRRV